MGESWRNVLGVSIGGVTAKPKSTVLLCVYFWFRGGAGFACFRIACFVGGSFGVSGGKTVLTCTWYFSFRFFCISTSSTGYFVGTD